MLMVEPEALRQSKPPETSPAPLGALVLPPTPQALNTGRLAAAAPARPMAASMSRREIRGPVFLGRALIAAVLFSGGDQRDLDRLLAAGDQIQTLLELGERQLMC